jgi:FMN reductase
MVDAGPRRRPRIPAQGRGRLFVLVVAVVGSPHAGGRTRVAVDAVLRGAAAEGADARVLELAETDAGDALAALGEADAAVFGSPTYRADITGQLKSFLDAMPRGMAHESGDPLRGKACAIVLTGASDHHFLAVEKVRGILGGFFAAQLLSPGLYFPSPAFGNGGKALADEPQRLAELHGRALVELAAAVRSSKWLRDLRPLI